MFRRLYFLLPNATLTQKIADELIGLSVNSNKIHTYAEHNLSTESLNLTTKNQSFNETREVEVYFGKATYYCFYFLCIGLLR